MKFKLEKKVLKKIKNYNAMETAKEIDYDEDGRATIYIGIKTADDFYSPISYKTYETVNNDVLQYLEDEQQKLQVDENICVDVHIEEGSSNIEKTRIRNAVKRDCAEKIVDLKRQLKEKIRSGILVFILGVLTLILGFVLDGVVSRIIVDSIVIVAWVFEWNAIEMLLFERPKILKEITRKFQLMNAKVHVRKYSKTIQKQYDMVEE